METKIIKKSAELPIKVDLIKCFLKIDNNEDDDLIENLIRLVSGCISESTKKMIGNTIVECKHNNNKILLPYTPMNSIISVMRNGKELKYSDKVTDETYIIFKSYDSVGVETQFSYKKDFSVVVTYNAGYELQDLPNSFELSIIRIVSDIYLNREKLSDVQEQIYSMLHKQMAYTLA